MENAYQFRAIAKEEIPQMFQLVLQRMRWMDAKGIRQWNATQYDQIYPQSYYEEHRQKGEVFVLIKTLTNQIACAGVLLEQDNRWNDGQPAIYLHNFVSQAGENGAGALFLKHAQEYARQKGKAYLRLDCAQNNPSLIRYYASHGFLPAGTCQDGAYKGVLQQKKLF